MDITTTGPLDINVGATTLDSSAGVAVAAATASSFVTTAGALTLTGAASSTWSTTAGALIINSVDAVTVDTIAAGPVNIATSNNPKLITIGHAASSKIQLSALAIHTDTTDDIKMTSTAGDVDMTSTAGTINLTGGVSTNTVNSTGTHIGATGRLGFYAGTSLIAQPTTGGAAGAFVANTSGIGNDSATFGGYTIGQISFALQNLGLLA